MINVGNFLGTQPKAHQRSNRLDKRRVGRNKVYWSRSTGSSAGCGTIRIKPKAAGQKLYIVVGNGGDNSSFGQGSLLEPTHRGNASGVGTLSDYSSNIWVSPQGDLQQVGKAFNSGQVGLGANAVGYSPGGFDTTLWANFQIISNPTPANGAWSAIYDSWNTPASKRTASAYNGVEGGPGSSGYNDYAQNYSSYPAIGGYVKITIVE